jgi:hypothetical protein
MSSRCACAFRCWGVVWTCFARCGECLICVERARMVLMGAATLSAICVLVWVFVANYTLPTSAQTASAAAILRIASG